jgi:hypothetical protein
MFTAKMDLIMNRLDDITSEKVVVTPCLVKLDALINLDNQV